MTTTASDFIRAHKDEILRLWFDRASNVASARGLDRPQFANLMPKFLAALADVKADLGTFSGERRRYLESHVSSRIRQGFSVDEIATELGLVRAAAEHLLADPSRDLVRPPESELERLWTELNRAAASATGLFISHMAEDEQVEKHYLLRLRSLAAAPLRTAGPPLRERLDDVARLVMEAMHADSASLFLYDAGAHELISAASVGLAAQAQFVASLDIASFTGTVAASEEPTHLANVKTTRLEIPAALRESGIRSLLGIRLPERETLTGVLYVGTREQRPFSGRDTARLEVLGEQLTLHLDNAALIERLHSTIAELREERVLRERFVSVLAHDLRGPLSNAKMAVQLLAEQLAGLDSDGPRGADAVARIERNLDRTDRMVRDLLDANRIQAGEPVPLVLVECDLVAIAREAIAELSAAHGERFLLAGDAAVRGTWGADELRRSLWNLGRNAVKYGAPETPITLSVRAKEDHAELGVHNQGPPIPRDEREALFRPFVRSRAMRNGAKGWGLGLTLVRGAAEAHGGRVRVESDVTSGTTFTLELPYRSSGAA